MYIYNVLFVTDLPHPYNKIGDGPEGPEIRTVADKLRLILVGSFITTIMKSDHGKIKGNDILILPAKIVHIWSKGKKLIFNVVNYDKSTVYIIFSYGMEGRLQFNIGQHSNVCFHLQDRVMYFDDSRRFGSIDIIPSDKFAEFFSNMGPDLLQAALNPSTWISSDQWVKIFTNPSIKNWCICKALLDQSLVSGIGNYLKSEILYYSAIHPEKLVSHLSPNELELLRICAHKIILLAYAHGGLTIKSYISPDGQKGLYPAAVYGRQTDNYGNKIIKSKTKDGRGSYWVSEFQKL